MHPAGTTQREFDCQKHWWGMRLVELGHRAIYMDSDAVVLGDLLRAFQAPYEVQGLSDWFEAELFPTGEAGAGNRTCGLYRMVPDAQAASGAPAVPARRALCCAAGPPAAPHPLGQRLPRGVCPPTSNHPRTHRAAQARSCERGGTTEGATRTGLWRCPTPARAPACGSCSPRRWRWPSCERSTTG